MISAFTVQNDSGKTRFELQEMKKLFDDFKIIHYFEELVDDSGHPGKPEPHQHGVVRIVVQKRNQKL